MRILLTAFICIGYLSGCSTGAVDFPTTAQAQSALAAQSDVAIIRLGPDNISNFANPSPGPQVTKLPAVAAGEYRIGAGDVLSVFVFDHPELAVPTGASVSGFLVKADGTFAYPFIGSVKAEGRTVEELRKDLVQRLAQYLKDPQVDLRVEGFNSQRVVVGGEVQHPTTLSLGSAPTTLLEALNSAGGLSADADASAVKVRRNGVSYLVDLSAFMSGDISGNNPILTGGDLVAVPRQKVKEAYILGEIHQPAPVDLSKDPVSLTQALTRQGGLEANRADARGVFVFRSVDGGVFVYQLDTSSPTGLLLGNAFQLLPMDVVYVTTAPLQRWNDTISRLLPTVSAYGAARNVGQ